jgi:LAS superfamily LD-carboxypeptidase LdcB
LKEGRGIIQAYNPKLHYFTGSVFTYKWDECNVNIYWHIVSNEYDKKNSQLIDIGIF